MSYFIFVIFCSFLRLLYLLTLIPLFYIFTFISAISHDLPFNIITFLLPFLILPSWPLIIIVQPFLLDMMRDISGMQIGPLWGGVMIFKLLLLYIQEAIRLHGKSLVGVGIMPIDFLKINLDQMRSILLFHRWRVSFIIFPLELLDTHLIVLLLLPSLSMLHILVAVIIVGWVVGMFMVCWWYSCQC